MLSFVAATDSQAQCCTSATPHFTHHFVVDFMKVDFNYAFHYRFTFERDKGKTYATHDQNVRVKKGEF
jgi:hypothetical protein